MLTRLLSTLVLAPLFLAAIWYGSPYFEGSVALLAVIAGAELLQISCNTSRGILFLGALALYLLSLVALIMHQPIGAGGAALLAAVIAWFISRRKTGNRFWSSMGLLYILISAIAIFEIRGWTPAGRDWIFWFFTVVWSADIGAYVVGKIVGGPKLAPSISPGKTWSGAVGGQAAAMIISVVFSKTLLQDQGIMGMIFLGGATCVASQIGDLLESYFKRVNKVKDSGKLIPGHGGVLDRIDGILLAAPVACVLIPHFTEAMS